jgi:hypothetical protein
MTLIELLISDLSSYQTSDGYSKAVFVKQEEEQQEEIKDHNEILQYVKSRIIKLENEPNIFDNPGWLLIGSTSALLKAIQECKIECIDREFEGFCFYMGW